MTNWYEPMWTEIPGYTAQSRQPNCSINGTNKQHDRVFRGPMIDYEGFFDISETAARQLAGLIGFISADEAEEARDAAGEIESELIAAQKEIASLRDQVKALTIANAELYTQLAAYVVDDAAAEGEEADLEGEWVDSPSDETAEVLSRFVP